MSGGWFAGGGWSGSSCAVYNRRSTCPPPPARYGPWSPSYPYDNDRSSSLRHVADLREAEIADSLGISRSTVSTTLRDAHNRLGRLLDAAPEIKIGNDKEATSARTF
jgi:hypothetical protein